MDFGKAFIYISEDKNWMRKLGIGAVVSIIPFLNFAAMGYQVQISRNVARGEERPLPEWNNLGDLFLDGLRVIGAMFVYMLPMLILYGLTFAFFITTNLFTMTEYGSSTPSSAPPEIFAVMSILMMCAAPYFLAFWLFWPMIFIQVARKNKIAACFDFRDMWQLIRQDWVNYLLIVGIYFALSMGMSLFAMPVVIVLIFIPCLGFIAAMFIQAAMMILLQAVTGHLQGQFILGSACPKMDPPLGIENELI